LSFKEYFGYQDSLIPRLATGFGGGVGRKGSLCGAFTGSIMAIGMKMGRTDPKDRETLLKVYEKCQQYWEKFEKEFGSRDCYALIGYHLDEKIESGWNQVGEKSVLRSLRRLPVCFANFSRRSKPCTPC
jgi:C_GCAxxG_C_C family probable redox protein